MRNRSTRAIVGLLVLTGLATSQMKQAGFLTGQVVPTLSCSNLSTTLTFSEGSPNLVPATMESFPRYGINNNPPHYAPFPYSNPPSYQSAGVRISVDPVVSRWVYVAAGLPPLAAGATAPSSPGGTLLSTIMQSGTSTGTPTELPPLTTTITFVDPSSGATTTAVGSSIRMWVYSQAGTVNLKSYDTAGNVLEQKSAPASTNVQFSMGNVARIELVSNYPAGGVAIDNLQYTLNLSCSSASSATSCTSTHRAVAFDALTPGSTIATTQFQSAGLKFSGSPNSTLTVQNYGVLPPNGMGSSNFPSAFLYVNTAGQTITIQAVDPVTGQPIEAQPNTFQVNARALGNFNSGTLPYAGIEIKAYDLAGNLLATLTRETTSGFSNVVPTTTQKISKITIVGLAARNTYETNSAGFAVSYAQYDTYCPSTSSAATSSPAQCVQTDPAYCGPKGCPAGFLGYGGKTYLRYDTAAGSWDSARAHCQSIGGDLVSINDAGEQTAVYEGLVGTGRRDIWIGLSDSATEGTFKWVDGTTPTYTNWQTGNPDDEYFNEDCVEMNYKNHPQTGKWNDFRCSDGEGDNTGFICELPLNCDPSFVDIKVNGQDGTISVAPNTPVTVTWTSRGVVSCDTGTAPAPWGPNKAIATSGSQQYTPASTQTIGIQCTSTGGTNRDVQDSVAMVILPAGQCPISTLNFGNAGSYTSVTTQYQAQGVRFSTARTGTAATGDPKAVVPYGGAYNVYSPSNKSDPANTLSLAAYYSRLGINRPASPAPTLVIEFVTPSGAVKPVPGSSVSFYARTSSDIRGAGTAANPGTATSYDAAGNVLETKQLYSDQGANPVSGGYNGLTYDQIAAQMKVQFTTGSIAKIILQDSFTTGVIMDDLSFMGDCNNATCINNTIPDRLQPGQSFTAVATVGNNGTKTWTGNSYYAGIANYASWGLTNAGASWAGWPTASIAPGQSATLNISGKAPSVPGNYTYSYQMLQNGVESFGAVCSKTIIVETSYSCKAVEFDATNGTFSAQGWAEQKGTNATITGPLDDSETKYVRIADNSASGGSNVSLPLPRSILQDKDFMVEMKARIVSSSTGRPEITGATALLMAPEGRYVALYFDTNKFGTIKNLAWAQTVSRNTSDAFHIYKIAYKKNGAGVTDDTFDVYFDGEKVMTDVKLSDVAYIPSQAYDSLSVGSVTTDGTGTIDVAYVRFHNNTDPCVTYGKGASACSIEQGSNVVASQCRGTDTGGLCTVPWTQSIVFSKPFANVPHVLVTPAAVPFGVTTACYKGSTDQIICRPKDGSITKTGFTLECGGSPPSGSCPGYDERFMPAAANWIAVDSLSASCAVQSGHGFAPTCTGALNADGTCSTGFGFKSAVTFPTPFATSPRMIAAPEVVSSGGGCIKGTTDTLVCWADSATTAKADIACSGSPSDVGSTCVGTTDVFAPTNVGWLAMESTDACRVLQGTSETVDCPGQIVGGTCTVPFEKTVVFPTPFPKAPFVIVSPSRVSNGPVCAGVATGTDHVTCSVAGVTEKDFRVRCSGSYIDDSCGIRTADNFTKAEFRYMVIDAACSDRKPTGDSSACGLSEFYASDGTFEQQGWTSVADSDPNTNLAGPTTENGVSYVRLTDQSTAQGMRTSDTRITDAMLSDRDWTLEMKSRTVLSDPNGYVLGMNMLLVTPSNVSTSLFIEPSKFGLQAATPNAYTWGPSISRNTSDAFHTYVVKNKKNAAGASDDTIDVYFDGTKVLSDIPRSQLYVYDAGNGVQGISFGIGSSPGKGTMDVSYVRFKNDEATCPANPFKKVAVQCADGQDNDGDGKIDYATETEVLVKTWGPVSISPGGASVVAATGLQAGQFIKPTLATGGAVCESILRGNSAGSYYFAGVFTNDAGTYVQASPPNAPASRSIPLVSDPAWPLDIFKVPNGATQLKVFMPTGISFTGTCTLSGKVFDMQRSSNWPGDPECTSATDDSEAGQTCTDSDGGNNPLQKGFVNATGGAVSTGTDVCNANGTLQEFFCDANNAIQSAVATCDAGSSCADGACKAGTSSSAGSANSARVGFGGVAFDGNDIIFMPLQNADMSYHGNVLSFGPVCKPGACGDGTPTSDEQCDDGNTRDGDGCSSKCIWQPYATVTASSSSSSRSSSVSSSSSVAASCGDRIISAPEKCDDGNKIGGDGCSAFCQIETGWQCTPRLP